MPLSMYEGIVTSSSSLTIYSHDLQSSLRSSLSKETTLKTNEPTSIFSKHYGFSIIPSNFPTTRSPFWYNPSNTKQLKSALHNFVTTSWWKSRWSIDSSYFLHIQHHFTTRTFLFCKLSKVKIFYKASVHTNNDTLEGALTFQILFLGKWDLTRLDNSDSKT
jgi:hypothetical protein